MVKRILSVLLVLLLLTVSLAIAICSDEEGEDTYDYDAIEYIENPYVGSTLYVYNWGQNIADGTDGSIDIIKVFEHMYGIDVVYTTYASNEEMYTILAGGGINCDLIVPSEYMIARLKAEGLLNPLHYENIPNYENIAEQYRVGLFYDCDGEDGQAQYSVPYTVGMIGIVYNSKYVSEEDLESASWGLMWNENYKDKILNFNNSRDAFGVAMLYLGGEDFNSTDNEVWQAAYEALLEQKRTMKGYVMDEIFDEMEGENAYIGAYYAGDCITMMDENEDLAFFYPVEGTNLFVDAMCVPSCAKNQGAAELFINFLLEPEWAIENSLYICYASPNEAVVNDEYYIEEMGEDYYALLYEYPETYFNENGNLDQSKCQWYHDLPTEQKELLANLWDKLKTAR